MPMIRNVPATWSDPVTLAADEVWQCRVGAVQVTVAADPELDEGIVLFAGQAMPILTGKTIRYRRAGPGVAMLAREAL